MENKNILIDENISIEITTCCNSKCTHCFARAGLSKLSTLSIETIKEIIDESFDLGYRNLHITGGEPLLHKSFFDIIDYAFTKGFNKIFCNTNGSLFNKENCEKLSKYSDKISFSISLQGNKSLHDKIRGIGTYEKACTGITNALEYNLDISIFTSVGKSLLPDLPKFVEFVFENFKNIKVLTLIQMIRVTDDIFDMSNEVLSPEEFIKFVQTVSMLNLYGYKLEILENPLAFITALKLGMKWIPQSPPLHRSGRIIIMANNEIGLAHSTRFSLGKYNPGILNKIVNSNEYKSSIAADKKICPKCLFYEICSNNNMLRPSEWYRDMIEDVPYCKRVLSLFSKNNK